MLKNKAVARYLRRTKKYLTVSARDRQTLLIGLRQELTEFAEENPVVTYGGLVETFGKPYAAARELMESAGLEENPTAVRRRRIVTRAVIALLFLLLAGLTVELLSVLSHQEVKVTEIIYYDGKPRKLPDTVTIGGDKARNDNLHEETPGQ